MHLEDAIESGLLDFSNIPPNYYLLGLLSAFENRFQAMADSMMQEVSWKQFFAIICINLCQEPPTLKELSEILGSSHQNVKQILTKLEKKGFVEFLPDVVDKRKRRIVLTDQCREFCDKNDDMSREIMRRLFDGVSEEEIASTVQTLLRIERNMREA
ncbi:MAG: MarR family transcriptional regulator [Coriobacteriales bacterium]|nr:MarR family transcriptional regulator [Coriobacteriales bacterium]